MDSFFRGWHYVDTFAFLVLFLGMVWYLVGKRQSMYLFYIFLLSSLINSLLKDFFNLSRPCQIISSVGIMHFSSPGLPSGAAQTAAIIAGFIILHSRRRTYQYLGIVFALFLCFSRIYLGLHYFTDVAAGLIIGFLLIVLYGKCFPLSEQSEKKVLILVLFVSAINLLIFQPKFYMQIGLSMGVSVGLLISTKVAGMKEESSYPLAEVLSAILGLLLILELKNLLNQNKLVVVFVGGFWMSFFGPLIVRKTKAFFLNSNLNSSHAVFGLPRDYSHSKNPKR